MPDESIFIRCEGDTDIWYNLKEVFSIVFTIDIPHKANVDSTLVALQDKREALYSLSEDFL